MTPFDIKEFFNMKMVELSEMLGYSHSYLGNLYNGKTKTPLRRYIVLKQHLSMIVDEIDKKEEEKLQYRKQRRKELIEEMLPMECISDFKNMSSNEIKDLLENISELKGENNE